MVGVDPRGASCTFFLLRDLVDFTGMECEGVSGVGVLSGASPRDCGVREEDEGAGDGW